jgi:hypothetical protein
MEMTKNLTKLAALPGSGGGCMSSLPAERNETVKVQMKAPYFQHDELEFPPIEPPPTIEELAKKYLAAHEGLME